MKILMTGNPQTGIAKEIHTLYPDATFASRVNGWHVENFS
jgi:hypothetical protein